MTRVYVQYGAGFSGPATWQNYDYSPLLRIQRIPLIGRHLVPKLRRFPETMRVGDIVSGLPVADGTVAAVYASHVLEHLALDDFRTALRNTFRMLGPGGVFRLVVPDLEERTRRYLRSLERGATDASVGFLKACDLGSTSRPRTVGAFMRTFLGHSRHLWMWDAATMTSELQAAGFSDVRRCEFGDAADPMFAHVEDRNRFVDTGFSPAMHELAMEARKPGGTA